MMDAVSSVLERTSTFILAGGQGERLHPLTVSRPKPAVSFGGVFRIVDFTLFNCLQSGLGHVSLLTQYKYEELHRYIREDWSGLWSRTPGCQQPLLCLPPVSGKRYRGTADAIKDAISTRLHRSQVDSRAQVNGSVLSPGVRVEKNATVSDSVLMPGVRIGHGTQLRRAVVEEGVHVPAGFCAGFDVDHDRNHHTVSEGGVVVIAGEPVNGCSRRVVNNLFMSA